jgi:predicted RNase H-like HicB family nuclease
VLFLKKEVSFMDLSYTYWQDDGYFLGYLNAFPDHWTQGHSLPELEEMLIDVHELLRKDTVVTTEKKTGVLTIPA